MRANEENWIDLDEVERQSYYAVKELLSKAKLARGNIVVLGCSSSEVMGTRIGSNSNEEIAQSIVGIVNKVCLEAGVFLAVQCCEHLNRALVIERQCMERYGFDAVNVLPVATAGGACAAEAMRQFIDPVVVEKIQAHAGIDIGHTLIGMHLKSVVVPVRLEIDKIGLAPLVAARTRPKYIGGPRAHYANPKER